MTFQVVRGLYEQRIFDVLTAAGIDKDRVFFSNVGETPGKSDEDYAVVSLSFAGTVIDTVNCEGVENIKGSLNVEVYTKKNKGSGSGENYCLEVMKDWQAINAWRPAPADSVKQACIRNVLGPITIEPSTKPHHLNVVSAVFMCRVS